MKTRQLFLVLVLVLVLPALSAADQKPAEDMARELLEISGSGELGVQMMHQMFDSYKASMPNVPAEFWDEVMNEVDASQLVELVVPIYVKHLTQEEMEAAIAFYKTPAGKAMLEKMPVIMQESMVAGQAWGQEINAQVQTRLKEKMESEKASQ
ncbi:MAG: DUF2059 domain-containing protein [Acidobacteriota bacterium]